MKQFKALLALGVIAIGFSRCNKSTEVIKLHVLSGGSIEVPNASVLGIDSISTILQNRVYLLEHPKGTLMWDTGLPEHYADSANGVITPLSTEKVTKKLSSQLDELGISSSSIDYVALSHAHSDHAGNMELFKSATLLIQEAEYNLAISDSAHKYFIHGEPIKTVEKVELVANEDFDVFGDGKVLLKYSPGHTIGHQSLFVKLNQYGNILISGDLYHHPKNRIFGSFPVFNYNHKTTHKSAKEIENFISSTNAELWIQHAPFSSDSIRYSPYVYQ